MADAKPSRPVATKPEAPEGSERNLSGNVIAKRDKVAASVIVGNKNKSITHDRETYV